MLRCLNCVLCAPNGLRGVMDLARGPLGAFRGRFWPFLAVFGPFDVVLGRLAGLKPSQTRPKMDPKRSEYAP